jgi:hypothetical protein
MWGGRQAHLFGKPASPIMICGKFENATFEWNWSSLFSEAASYSADLGATSANVLRSSPSRYSSV